VIRKQKIITMIVTLLFSVFSLTQTALADDLANAAAQANNPLANMKAFNLHNYYIGETSGPDDDDANQFWMRYAQPFSLGESNWLMRASLPVNSFPTKANGDWETGLGDFNVFAAWLIPVKNPAISFGVGPQLTIPTATDETLGSEKWSAGLANVLFDARSTKFQYGYLLTWQHSFAGESERSDVNIGAFQPFGMLQLGGGHYLRSTGIWVYNFESDSYSMPIGLGYGKVFKKGNIVYNAFIEPQYSVADSGAGQPVWQVFVGLNMQFTGP
jgi:hypothetical protein